RGQFVNIDNWRTKFDESTQNRRQTCPAAEGDDSLPARPRRPRKRRQAGAEIANCVCPRGGGRKCHYLLVWQRQCQSTRSLSASFGDRDRFVRLPAPKSLLSVSGTRTDS